VFVEGDCVGVISADAEVDTGDPSREKRCAQAFNQYPAEALSPRAIEKVDMQVRRVLIEDGGGGMLGLVELTDEMSIVGGTAARGILLSKCWPPVLLAPFVERNSVRAAEEITGDSVAVCDDASELALGDNILPRVQVPE
jgi:hypothetical protein